MSEPASVGDLPVSAVMADAVNRVSPEASLQEIAQAIVDGDVGALAVGEGDRVVGIVSERDVVRALAEKRAPETTRAIDLASTSLVWCDVTSSVAEVAREMLEQYVRHVLVEQDGQLVGVVSARDLLGVYAAAEPEPDE